MSGPSPNFLPATSEGRVRKWLLVLMCVFPALHAQAPALPDGTLLALVARVPAFAAPGPRTDVAVRRQMAIPESDDQAHFVEITWREAGATRTALLAVIRTARLDADMPPLATHDGWSIARLQEDEDWDSLIRQLKDARAAGVQASAVGNVRSMISAQMTFAAVVGEGAYAADVKCLVAPRLCGLDAEPFLPETFPSPDRMGYRYTLTPAGASAALRSGAKTCAGFVFTAVPIDDASMPSFCADQEGVVCRQPAGTPLVVSGGACPKTCAPLQ